MRLLVSLQAYAAERLLEAGPVELERIQERHGAYFAAMGHPDALRALRGPRGVQAWRALAAEHDNLAAAATRAVGRGDGYNAALTALAAWAVVEVEGPPSAGTALLLAVLPIAGALAPRVHLALGQAYRQGGHAEDAVLHFDAARALFETAGDQGGAARALTGLAGLWRMARDPRARPALSSALAAQRAVGDLAGEADVLVELGRLRSPHAEVEEARGWLRSAQAIFTTLDDQRSEGLVLDYLGQLSSSAGLVHEAVLELDRARVLLESMGHRSALATLLGNLGFNLMLAGEMKQALERFHEGLRLQRLTGRRASMAFTHMHLGNLYCEAGDFVSARRHLEAALPLTREASGGRRVGFVLGNLGAALMEAGELEGARARLDEALAVLQAAGDPSGIGAVQLVFAQLALREGRPAAARGALEVAEVKLDRTDPVGWGQLLAARAEVFRCTGDRAGAAEALAALGRLAQAQGWGPTSMLGLKLARESRALAAVEG